jgi:hypothetical protein
MWGDDGTQFVTSGGGGAFLHPTHALADTVNIDRPDDGIVWLGGRVKTLTLAERPASGPKAAPEKACYPSRSESRRMLAGNLAFPVYNPGFAVILGVIYWLLGLAAVQLRPFDGVCIALVVLCGGFLLYTRKQEGGGAKVNIVSIANGVIHAVALIYLAHLANAWNAHRDLPAWPRDGMWRFLIFALEMIAIGGVVAAELFGIYLALSSALLNLNHNDAFSSMRRDSHRHILRMRLTANEATLYPIGLDRVPRRHEWRRNEAKRGSPAPAFVPAKPLMARLIEPPVLIRVPPTPPPPGAPAG